MNVIQNPRVDRNSPVIKFRHLLRFWYSYIKLRIRIILMRPISCDKLLFYALSISRDIYTLFDRVIIVRSSFHIFIAKERIFRLYSRNSLINLKILNWLNGPRNRRTPLRFNLTDCWCQSFIRQRKNMIVIVIIFLVLYHLLKVLNMLGLFLWNFILFLDIWDVIRLIIQAVIKILLIVF